MIEGQHTFSMAGYFGYALISVRHRSSTVTCGRNPRLGQAYTLGLQSILNIIGRIDTAIASGLQKLRNYLSRSIEDHCFCRSGAYIYADKIILHAKIPKKTKMDGKGAKALPSLGRAVAIPCTLCSSQPRCHFSCVIQKQIQRIV